MMTFVFIFLAIVAAYYFLGTPLLDFIHKFTQQFTHSFPLWAFFLPQDPGIPRPRRGRSAAAGGPPRF